MSEIKSKVIVVTAKERGAFDAAKESPFEIGQLYEVVSVEVKPVVEVEKETDWEVTATLRKVK